MQPDSITLSVDTDNDGGTTAAVDLVLTRSDYYENRSEYLAAGHSVIMRDKVNLYRTRPKPNGNFRGVAKSAVKFTKDFEVEGMDTTTKNVGSCIIDVGFNFPVGMTPAETLEMRMRAVALLRDDTIMVALTDQQLV